VVQPGADGLHRVRGTREGGATNANGIISAHRGTPPWMDGGGYIPLLCFSHCETALARAYAETSGRRPSKVLLSDYQFDVPASMLEVMILFSIKLKGQH
jgi:hypothetical protein